MAASEYYNHSTYPATGAAGSSSAMRAELELVEAGFAKLPDLAGNAGKLIVVNAGGTALEAVTDLLDGVDFGTPSAIVLDNATGNIDGCTADGSNAIGFKDVPQSSKSTAYTLALSDAGKHLYHPSADTSARTWTIPANASVAFPVGTAVTFINGVSAGAITIAITSDTLRMAGLGVTGSRTLAASGMATAIKVTTTEWFISGAGLT